jgi:hypothetical protein
MKILPIALLAMHIVCNAQENTPTSKIKSKNSVSADQFGVSMFSDRVLRHPPIHSDIGNIIKLIKKRTKIIKGEFEATSDFEDRKSAAMKIPINKPHRTTGILFFNIPVTKFDLYGKSYIAYQYDADTRTAHFYARPLHEVLYDQEIDIGSTTNREMATLTINQYEEPRSTYTGSNAFGASAKIVKIRKHRLGVAFLENFYLTYSYDDTRSRSYDPKPIGSVKMEPKFAAKELPKIRATLAIKPRDPLILHGFKYFEPTFDNPIEMTIESEFLYGEFMGIVFYSGNTGEIYARAPSDFGSPSQSQPPSTEQPTSEEK